MKKLNFSAPLLVMIALIVIASCTSGRLSYWLFVAASFFAGLVIESIL